MAGVTDEPAIVRQAMLVFKSLQTRALPVDASRDTITRVADELWKVPARTGAKALTAVPTAAPGARCLPKSAPHSGGGGLCSLARSLARSCSATTRR
jgi:hypothetical protein